MKLATWNVNSLNVRLPHVMQWLEQNPTDVLCIQETTSFRSLPSRLPVTTWFTVARRPITASPSCPGCPSPTWSRTIPSTKIRSSASWPPPSTACAWCALMCQTDRASIPINTNINWAGCRPSMTGSRKKRRCTRNWPWWATTISRRKTATSTTRPGMGRPDPLLGQGARGPARLFGLGLTDAFRLFEQPRSVQLVGLPPLAFRRNRGLRIDHILLSPSAGQALQRLRHRPRAAQVGAAVRPHAGDRDYGLKASSGAATGRASAGCENR
jgi:exodeoxyribonuclease-3